MDSTPQDLYAKHLPTSYGYPLWNPGPSNTLPQDYRQDGLQIGDVGVVHSDRGFDAFFNICKPHDHRLHQLHGIPPSLRSAGPTPLRGDDVHVKSDAIPPCSVIRSYGVQQRQRNDTSPASEYEFTVRSSEGAILILPHGAAYYELKFNAKFRNSARENARDWYRFIVEDLGIETLNGSLYLITGFYKARSWSIASFQNTQRRKGWSIRAIGIENGDGLVNYRWEHEFHTFSKYWPIHSSNSNASVNQSIFLRGYRITLRDRLLRTVLPAVSTIPLSLPAASEASWLVQLLTWMLAMLKRRKLVHYPKHCPAFHYSDIINGHLLSKNPDASMAVTHDSDWTKLLVTGELKLDKLAEEGYLVEFLSSKYHPGLCDDVVYFVIDGYDLDDGPSERMIGPSNEDSPIVVFSIRDAQPIACPECQCTRTESNLVVNPRGLSGRQAAATEFNDPSPPNNSRVVITRIRGDQLTPARIPTECYVSVQTGGIQQKTKNRPVVAEEATEWDDKILLPPELSATLQLSVCQLQFSLETAKEETLYSLELSVEKLLKYCERGGLITFSSEGEDAEELGYPSLLITTERKILEDLDDSLLNASLKNSRSREEALLLAKDAKGAQRWEDLVNHMKGIVDLDQKLTSEERDLLSVGYKNLIAARCALWSTILSDEQEAKSENNMAGLTSFQRRRQKLEDEIVELCKEVLDILTSHLIPSTTSMESALLYHQMVGDYYRCLSDFETSTARRQKNIQNSLEAYEDAWRVSISCFRAAHPIRLRLALNLATFYNEVLHSPDQAVHVARMALDHAGPDNQEDTDSLLAMKCLHESIARWMPDVKEGMSCIITLSDEQGDSESLDIIKDVPMIDNDLGAQSNKDGQPPTSTGVHQNPLDQDNSVAVIGLAETAKGTQRTEGVVSLPPTSLASPPSSALTVSGARQSRQASLHNSVHSVGKSSTTSAPEPEVPKISSSPSEWTVDEVVEWLKSKGFGSDVYDKFIEQEITGDILLELGINLLKAEIGIVAFGKRVRIANAIAELRRPLSPIATVVTTGAEGSDTEKSENSTPEVQPTELKDEAQHEQAGVQVRWAGVRGQNALKPGRSIVEQIGQPDHQGWMRKKGDYNSWKLRYFIIKGLHLYILQSDRKGEMKIKGYVNIVGYKVVADENIDPGRYGFRIVHETGETHFFSSDEQAIMREWMKAIMKATIGRDYSKPVVSSVNIPTIPLTVAQAMNPAPRPPSPTARAATQKALRRENPNQLSTRDVRVLMGLSSPDNAMHVADDGDRMRLESFSANQPAEAGVTTANGTKGAPPRPSREAHQTSASAQDLMEMGIDSGLVDWANSHLPRSHQMTDPAGPLFGGLAILRLAEDMMGKSATPLIPDSAFPIGPNDDKLDGLFRLFDFLLDNDVKMGSIGINDVRQGKRDKVMQLLKALKTWEDRRKEIMKSLGQAPITNSWR